MGSGLIMKFDWWSQLWKLPIPAKVAIFIWKTCHESIPTFVPLRRRCIGALPWCQVCGRKEGSMLFLSAVVLSIFGKVCLALGGR